MFKRLFTAENLIVAGVIFAAIFFAKFPTLYHWLNTPKGYWYPQNTSWFDAWDTNFQVSYMKYAQRKGLAIKNTYTTTEHQPVVIYQYFTFLGIINRVLRMDPFILYHLATIISAIILIISCYLLSKLFFSDSVCRLGSFIVMVLGGGAGWIPKLSSADMNLAGFTTINAFEKGQDALSTAFLLLSFYFIFSYLQFPKRNNLILAVIFACGNIIFHPPFAALYLTAGSAIALLHFSAHRRKELFIYPLACLIFFGIYFALVFYSWFQNPGFAGVIGQNLYNADSFALSLGFGLLSLFIFAGFIKDTRQDIKITALKIVFLSQLFFLLSPLGFHLYFAKGIFGWGVILGFAALPYIVSRKNIQLVIITIIVFLSLLPRMRVFDSLINASTSNYFFFLTKDEGDALAFIAKLPPDKGILSLYRIGNYIPAHSDDFAYAGHKFQTPDFIGKKALAEKFYASMGKDERKKFLAENHIDYIYYGMEEAGIRNEQKLDPKNPFPEYPVVYQNDSSIIYSAQFKTRP